MPQRVLFISFALLFGACDDTTVGQIRQIDNHQPIISVERAEADTSVTDTFEPDTTVVPDSAIVLDTTPVDTSIMDSVSDTDTRDTTDTLLETDTGFEEEVVTDPCAGMVCNDNNACTTDTCVEGDCEYSRIAISDGDSCTTDTCDTVTGIMSHEQLDCDDDNTATVDTCENGECVNTLNDHDFDGYAACVGTPNGSCDCDDVSTSGGAPASFCMDGVGYYLVIDFAAGDYSERPDCSYYNEYDNLVEGVLIFETDGSFLNGPQVSQHDTPTDGYDNDCDGETDEAEPGLDSSICAWYGSGNDDGVWFVECSFMEDI